ncbi:GNAT family N-acetyltransferase [Brevibacillus laterosporus]|uniref:Putative ribosomal N-acetyltransferase YdaF n=1 Tax=Brevibacillus laterosporus LMG 15441 TaxID=1042163 RepID=A0A075R1U7_BRELA|nr:GNAT family N-acetyltransferase [Brevibacillus laterosporus]AIG25824.1 putative ribosomal N-acetyltransferase YdaF [Brevibacillus laterosporus LMG 15441]RJL12855.1 GNAT family N-acetyltransferase [Brevibacillus laterosporus]TPH08235.1 GNAT family N-acetyltransferase [Brevibacillus laterosporus]
MNVFNLRIKGRLIFLQLLTPAHAEFFLTYLLANQPFHAPYVPLRDESYFTLENAINQTTQWTEVEQDQRYSFGIFEQASERLVGKITLSQVFRGPFQNAFIGYDLDHSCQSQGYMTEALHLMMSFSFNRLLLHRLQANIMPHNRASQRVLEKAGFAKEGFGANYLKINGKWEDHLFYALTKERFDELYQNAPYPVIYEERAETITIKD